MNYLIIGAGPAGVVAAETLRKLDESATITLLGDEPEPPYSRMAIPYLLRANIDEQGTYLRKQQDYFSNQGIDTLIDRVESVDASAKQVKLASGSSRAYDKLLVASGSRPITPPIPGIELPGVTSCWTLEDARKISAGIKPGAKVVLIGAGFIGCIILEALVSAGAKLTVIEMGDRMVPRMLDKTCGLLLQKWCEQKGIKVLTKSAVKSIESAGSQLTVEVKGSSAEKGVDLVISATGVQANIDCLKDSGIKVENGGVLVDEYMASSLDDIYVAGDAACGKDFSTGEYSVQAIQPIAVEHGRVAANNMHQHGSVKYQGAVPMNVLDTIGLVSTSYGLWEGVKGGENSELVDETGFRYIRLCFDGERLVGANTLGMTQHIGVIRGLIQGRFALGKWKDQLLKNPLQLMEAYLAVTQG